MNAKPHRLEKGRRRIPRAAGWLLAASVIALALGAAAQSPRAGGSTSPLAAYPGFGHDPVADESRFNSEEQNRENMIASCMQGKGFFYAPSSSVYVDGSTTRDQLWQLAENDPNNQYTSTLSPSQWEQYSLALDGVPDANDPSTQSNGGCLSEAYDAVPGVFAAYNALREPYEQMQRDIASDPRVVAAEQRWSSCMSSYGYSYATPAELAAAPDATPAASPAPSPAASPSGEPSSAPDSAAAASDASVSEYTAAQPASGSCMTEAGVEVATEEASIEQETAFVDRYRDVLDYYRAKEG